MSEQYSVREYNEYHRESFGLDTYEEALSHVRRVLEDEVDKACITHPDGTKEYWRAEIKRKAVKCEPGYADWDDE